MEICRTPLILLFSVISTMAFSQDLNVIGTVKDGGTNQILPGATVIEKGTTNGTFADDKGKFEIKVKSNNQTLVISYLGYNSIEVALADQSDVKAIEVTLARSVIQGDEIVISASRFNETILESPSAVQKVNARQIQSSASGDFFESLGNLKEINITNNSFNFKIINTRGFNSSVGYRTVQFIDGADNLSSGINFSPGNFLSVPEIDLDNIEVISGPASALYGPNALSGVISMTTKSPFDYEGIDVELTGGNQSYMGAQMRYANAFGKDKTFGFKVTASYNRADDWVAQDSIVNNHRVAPSPPQNLDGVLTDLSNDASLSQTQQDAFDGFLNYVASDSSVLPGTKSFITQGYKESELYDALSDNLKVFSSIHYKKGKSETILSYRFAKASGTWQGNNRVYFKNQVYHQPKIEFRLPDFFLRGYATIEDLGESYSFNITGIDLGFASLGGVSKAYVTEYVNSLQSQTNNFTQTADSAMIAQAAAAGLTNANTAWLQPGTEAFDGAFDQITSEPLKPIGSLFINESKIVHFDGQYDVTNVDYVDLNVGFSFRYNIPRTNGTVLADTMLADGSFADISYYETGGFAQLSTKNLLSDKLKFLVSLRVDKSTNFDVQVSPRGAVVFTTGSHSVRLIGQSAFRNPSQNEQYFHLNAGPIWVLGNITGYSNLYTLGSVKQFAQTGDANDLETITLDPVAPENVKSVELGYRGKAGGKLFIDLNAYYNKFSNFIGRVNTAQPQTGVAGEQSGVDDVMNGNTKALSIIVNSTSDISAFGGGLGLSYYLGNGLTAYTNYTYAKLDTAGVDDPLIPGFNTPQHKLNVGLDGNKVWKGLGFSANFRWVDEYLWESAFATGTVPSFHLLDLQLNYSVPKIHSVFRVGGSNILDNEHIEAYGSSTIGAFYYATWSFGYPFK